MCPGNGLARGRILGEILHLESQAGGEEIVPSGHTLDHLFAPEPQQWGLRGDAYLWRELRTRGRKVPLPDTVDEVDMLLARMIGEVLEQRWDGLRGPWQGSQVGLRGRCLSREGALFVGDLRPRR